MNEKTYLAEMAEKKEIATRAMVNAASKKVAALNQAAEQAAIAAETAYQNEKRLIENGKDIKKLEQKLANEIYDLKRQFAESSEAEIEKIIRQSVIELLSWQNSSDHYALARFRDGMSVASQRKMLAPVLEKILAEKSDELNQVQAKLASLVKEHGLELN